jgi:hypothetical protein
VEISRLTRRNGLVFDNFVGLQLIPWGGRFQGSLKECEVVVLEELGSSGVLCFGYSYQSEVFRKV